MTATSTTDEAEQRRAARRRRLQQRQTVIFGGLITILLVLALVAAAMWSGLLPAPFSREFSSEEPTEQLIEQPCLPADAAPVDLAAITANVYNGTDRSGLAAATGSALGQVGVLVNQQANWPGGHYPETVQIVAGPIGVTAAYSLARLFPGSVVTLESTRADESADVVLGAGYEAMLTADEIAALDPAAPLTAPEDCTPVTLPTEAPAEG